MKVHKMVCINIDLAKRLEKENASALICKLLEAHFLKTDDPMALMSREELKFESATAGLELKSLDAIEKLKAKMLGAKK